MVEVKLRPLEKVAVRLPTQRIYDTVMMIYEKGLWKWQEGNLPTERLSVWGEYGLQTAVGAGFDHIDNKAKQFEYADNKFFWKNGWVVISAQEFYDRQGITHEKFREVMSYYEVMGKSTKSKVGEILIW